MIEAHYSKRLVDAAAMLTAINKERTYHQGVSQRNVCTVPTAPGNAGNAGNAIP